MRLPAEMDRQELELRAAEQFLFMEARLLDERRWQDWLRLFTEDGMYWVPLVRGQTDPLSHASLYYEDALLREVRARRLEEQRAWSQQLRTSTARIIGNVQLLPPTGGADLVVTSTFHLLEWRQPGPRLMGGFYTHQLKRQDGGFRILLKRVDLIDCESAHESLEVFV